MKHLNTKHIKVKEVGRFKAKAPTARLLERPGKGDVDALELLAAFEMGGTEFREFAGNLLDDRDFLEPFTKQSHMADGIARCILIRKAATKDGIAIVTEGFGYPRYTAKVRLG